MNKQVRYQVRYMNWKAGKVDTIAIDDPDHFSATISYLQKYGWKLDDKGVWHCQQH